MPTLLILVLSNPVELGQEVIGMDGESSDRKVIWLVELCDRN